MTNRVFPITEEGVANILPAKVKVTNPVGGVYLNIGAVTSTSKKMLPIMATSIPVGTILEIKENPKDKAQIETNFKVDNNVVFTTPKQILGNVEFVQAEAPTEIKDAKTDENKKDETKKSIFSTRNILISVGVIVAGFFVYKYVIKRK